MWKNKMKTILTEEEGSGLVLALMVLLVMSVLGASLGIVTVGSYRLGDINRDNNSAYYIAEAGANMAYEEIEKYVLKAYEDSNSSVSFFEKMEKPLGENNNENSMVYNEFDSQFGNQPTATIKVMGGVINGESKQYTVESVGKVAGKTRTVQKDFDVTWKEKNQTEGNIPALPERAAIVFDEKLVLENNSEVKGNILHSDGKIVKGNNVVHNVGYIVNYQTDWSNSKSYFDQFFPDEIYQGLENYNEGQNNIIISGNSFISSITLNNNEKLVIDTQGKTVNLMVDKLSFGNNSEIKVLGDGKLNLIYLGRQNVTLPNNFEYNGSIYLKQSTVNINNNVRIIGNVVSRSNINLGNNIDIQGMILSEKNIGIDNNVELKALLYAPNGNIELGNNAKLVGSIIAKNITINNNGVIEYSDKYYGFLPEDSETTVDEDDLISSQPAIESD